MPFSQPWNPNNQPADNHSDRGIYQSNPGWPALSYLYVMHGKLSGWKDTIVAIATPPGIGAIGVIRMSGPRAWQIVDSLFPSKNIMAQQPNTLHVGYLKDGDQVLDEVVLSLFKGPASYTGEDVVEISCHGSPYVQQGVLESLIGRGARPARAGEFTQRAFLNGKMDLTQAEAVADLIASNTSASQQAALSSMRGGFSRILKDMRERLIQFAALIELELDFSEEDVEFADRSKFRELLQDLEKTTDHLLQSFRLGNVIKNGISVAIVGSPNAGKSTLLNALLNEERAIVSEIAGTTRDTIEEVLNVNGILFRLIDTAGIREHAADVIESMGVVRSKEKIRQADIVVFVFDIREVHEEAIFSLRDELKELNKKVIFVANKMDEAPESLMEKTLEIIPESIFISAKYQTRVHTLGESLFELATGDEWSTENVVVTNARHFSALKEVKTSLKSIEEGLDKKISGDLLASDIRRCLHFLGEITGEISNEDLLDYIFSKFCIGK